MNYLKIWSTLLLALVLGTSRGWAQPNEPVTQARHGWHLAPEGRLHILVIFAEINYDSTFGHLDPLNGEGKWLWKKGELPSWKDQLISPQPNGQGFMTDYFRQASFGKYQVTGDYVDEMITVNISDIRDNGKVVTREPFANNHYKRAVLDKVNAIPNLKFAFGSSLDDFDNLTLASPGAKKTLEANGKIDLVMLVFRNIHVANLGNHSGFVNTGNFGPIKGVNSDMYSIFRTNNFMPRTIMRHEFSHMLYGGNNFHTANGGVGQRTWLSTIGGWSNLSASDACSPTFNAWDRERMDWKNPANRFVTSARCENGSEVNGILEYGEHACSSGIYILRDFVTTGDAIKIPLPHLPDGTKKQYLWLENHQRKEGAYDHDKVLPPGLYAYIQAGKDIREGRSTFGGENNYLWPLPAIGHYDFRHRGDTLILEDERENPLTGYHYLMRQTQDLDGDGKIRVTTDVRPKTEYNLPSALIKNGQLMPEEHFSYKTYPMFGTTDVPFTLDGSRKIGISYNPAATPLYTHAAPGGPKMYDNRRIYLNGISIEIVKEGPDGELHLKIRWNDYDIVEDRRWCGNILSKESLYLTNGVTLTLDQGYSPQLVGKVHEINGENIFTMPTVLELAPGSETWLRENSQLVVQSGSTLLVRAGAKLDIGKKAEIRVEEGAFLFVEKGALISYSGKKGKFTVEPGAEMGIHPLLDREFPVLGERLARLPVNPN